MAILTNFEAQHYVDEEIAKYQAIICDLRTRRNTYAAISQLPPEIISKIFVDSNQGKQGVTRSLLNISSVCSLWRKICINTPHLWATISLAQPRWFSQMLHRSKSSPLTVYIPRCDRLSNDFAKMASALVPETSRFKDVGILYSSATIQLIHDSFLRPSFAFSAPLLQRLVIRPGLYGDEKPPRLFEEFWTDLVSIQSLALVGVFPRKISSMPSLTHLSIRVLGEGNPLTIWWLVDVLQNTPRIEFVEVGVLSSNSVTLLDESTSVAAPPELLPTSLPNLRSLRLAFKGLRESQIFSCLEMAAPITNQISFYNRDIPDEPGSSIAGLQAFVSSRIPHDASSLCVLNCNDYKGYMLQVKENDDRPMLINLSVTSLPSYHRRIRLVSSLPLGKIYRLILRGDMGDNEALAWSDLLPSLIHLRVITVERVTVLRSIATSSPNVTLGELSNLDLEEITINDDRSSTRRDWDHFMRGCEVRQLLGKPIRQLRVERSGIPKVYMDHMARYVNEVQWK
ncbi:hypothetical protein ONZ45_g10842 [Pleurotus djamor]|nr:hypothetical protein ONZ45_g10842 [Pleurotus djamor]